MARFEAVKAGDGISFGAFRLIAAERLLLKDGAPVVIGGRALDILMALAERAGEIVSARKLVDLVWPNVTVDEGNLRVNIVALRKVLGDGKGGQRYVVNVPGRGYVFVAPTERAPAATPATQSDAPRSDRLQAFSSTPIRLLGRDVAIAALRALVLSTRFVSVVGPGGIGKTTVALALMGSLREEFGEDGVCFVDFGSLTDPADVPNAFASALGCLVQGPDAEPYIKAFLADRRMLVVLDNCEHVIETAAPLAERVFQAAPHLHLMTTSREALRVEAENVHLLSPLDCPRENEPSSAAALKSSAVQLFMQRSAASGHHDRLSDEDAPIVANICRRLDGAALAIELVASRVGTYGIRGTLDLLESGAELFLQGRRSSAPRHQTLQAMLDWSYLLLVQKDKQVLCSLSTFVGQFTLSAAHAVAGTAGDAETISNAIASLVDKSLIWTSSTDGKSNYRLSDVIRAFAAAKLHEQEANAAARDHALYFAALMRSDASDRSFFDGRNVSLFTLHIGNVRKALGWCFSKDGDCTLGVELAANAAQLFLEVSLFAECQKWCRRALSALQDSERGSRLELELQRALAMSSMYTWGNSYEVSAAIERGLLLSDELQDSWSKFRLLADLNVFLTRRGDFSGALAAARRSAAVAEGSGGRSANVMAEWMLGASYHLAGDQAAALRHSQRGFKFASLWAPSQISLFYEARARFALARTLWLCGLPDQASREAKNAIAEMAQYSSHYSYCVTLIYSAPVLIWCGDHEEARAAIDLAIADAKKYSLSTFHALGMALKGELHVLTGDVQEGIVLLKEALIVMRSDQYFIMTSPATRALAEGMALAGRHEEARLYLEGTIADAEGASDMWLPELLRTHGEIMLSLPQPELALGEASLLRSIYVAQRQSALGFELKSSIPLARMWSVAGKVQEARSLLEAVLERFTEGASTRDLLVARQLLAELYLMSAAPVRGGKEARISLTR